MIMLFIVAFASGCGSHGVALNLPSAANPNVSQTVQHVVLVVEENHSYSEVIGNAAMPYFNQLAQQYGLATQYYADVHPSIGNYFMLTTGQIITLDDSFGGTVSVDNLVRQLVTAGKTWKGYFEGLPASGYTGGDSGGYLRHHNPFVFFSDVLNSPAQAANVVPFSQFSADLANGSLPNFSFVVPNARHDAHDCPNGGGNCSDNEMLSAADQWLQANLSPLLTNPAFQSSGVLIVVFDESQLTDLTNGGGHIAMVMAGSRVKRNFQSSTTFDHASTLRFVVEVLGLPAFPGVSGEAADESGFLQ